ncbi:hypothetical protein D0Z67_29190 (plasmid) [Streptomyces seoulensis]|uniref:Uncharacterized protein n=1 Tax=Streptomyces seoulensis TaxID=73044 RepID=A0A4V1A0F9_STRSO|nr:hypothetical protein [Streptomyces seoulensis]QBJ94446.1 hypothetical protein D0Z67_29190 [Streptomyces seoulensis]
MDQPQFEEIPSGEWSAAAVAQNDPELYADLVDLLDSVDPEPLLHAEIDAMYAGIDPLSYLDDVLTAVDPEGAAAAYEQMVTGEWDGDL